MKSLALLSSACWTSTDVQTRTVYVLRHEHDAPLACAHLPPFPGMTEACKPGWVKKISRWITFAGACLGVDTFEIDWFIHDDGCSK